MRLPVTVAVMVTGWPEMTGLVEKPRVVVVVDWATVRVEARAVLSRKTAELGL